MIIGTSVAQIPTQDREQQLDQQELVRKVRIYLRKSNKQAIALEIGKILKVKNVFQLAHRYFGMKSQWVFFMFHGQKFNQDCEQHSQQLIFNDNDIIHILQINSNIQKRIISFKSFDCEDFEDQKTIDLQLDADQKIGQSICEYFNTSKYSFVQCGRKLDIARTFRQQCVETQSTIIVTMFKHPQIVPNPSSPSKTVTRKTTDLKKVEVEDDINLQTYVENIAPRPILRKTVSWSSPQSIKLQSFKKKKKPSVYKSMKVKNGKQIIWQSDSSTQQNKQNVVKKLALKKHKRANQKQGHSQMEQGIKSVSSEQCQIIFSDQEQMARFDPAPVFSVQDKIDLKNQLKKLLFPNASSIQYDVGKLQPPEIILDTFGEQVEQVEEIPKQQEMTQTKSSSMFEQTQIKTPVNLRDSIGKSKGSFLPILNLNKMLQLEEKQYNEQQQQQEM